MKKIGLIVLGLLCMQLLSAQTYTLHISREGGGRKPLSFWKLTYNQYHFVNSCNDVDTLICKGSGSITCKLDCEIVGSDKGQAKLRRLYNRAIIKTNRLVRKSDKLNGELKFMVKGMTVNVDYKKLNKRGEGIYKIEMI